MHEAEPDEDEPMGTGVSRRAVVAGLGCMAGCAVSGLGPATAASTTPDAASPPAGDAADAALRQLFADSDEADLRLNPLNALYRGDLRYAGRFGDYLSDTHATQTRSNLIQDQARLEAIDRERLTPVNRIAYDVFRWTNELGRRGLAFTQFQNELPIDHFTGAQVFFPDLSSGQSAAPYRTLKDYHDGLGRIDGFLDYLNRAQARMRGGMASGRVQPAIVMTNVLRQLDTIIKADVVDSPYYRPVKAFPDEIGAADRASLGEAYAAVIRARILPAYARFKAFIETSYLPACRQSVGLSAIPDGRAVYDYLIERHTTTRLPAEDIHALGVAEVRRIADEMKRVVRKVRFKGDLRAFFDDQRSNPRFYHTDSAAVLDGYRAIGRRVDTALDSLFDRRPATRLEIRPVPDFLEQGQAAAYYQQGAPDGSRPGVFHVNTFDLAARPIPGMESLYLHEAVPGHHFQISLAQENAALPNFMRFDGNTAYVEGWALYAESLGRALGLYTDPYQWYGRLDNEMLRAMRLVIDTGLHVQGWSRDQAIAYMLDNSATTRTDAVAEVDRYIAMPGQALAYKVGELTLQRLRRDAATRLGKRFDVRAFHARVLETGALPMAVLEDKIAAWIAGA